MGDASRPQAALILVTADGGPSPVVYSRSWPVPAEAVAAIEDFLVGMYGAPAGERLMSAADLVRLAAAAPGGRWSPDA